MSKSTHDELYRMLLSIRDRLTDVMECLDEDRLYTEGDLPDKYEWIGSDLFDSDGNEVDPDDVPDVEWYEPHRYLEEYPLEVVDKRGRNFAVVLGTGGPHIEIEAAGWACAALHGYWGGEHVTLGGDVFDRVLDWFIDRDER